MDKIKRRKEYKRKCENCNVQFTAYRDHARFCSPACRVENWKERNWVKADKYGQLEERVKKLEGMSQDKE